MSEVVYRRMNVADVDQVTALERATFAIPWSRDSFMREMTENVVARYLVAERDGRIIGYAGAWVILDECHITNVAVAEAERGQGIGRQLTARLLQYVSNLGAAYATLEVRLSNLRAQHLYASLGFVTLGKRKQYYEDNQEDALLMVCERMPEAEADFQEAETDAALRQGTAPGE